MSSLTEIQGAFTTGPWEAEHHRSEPPVSADDPGYWTIEGSVMMDRSGSVADTLNRHHCISPEEDRANANLIAAAPQLLRALKELLPEGWGVGHMDHMPGIKLARLAIAKAEGRS